MALSKQQRQQLIHNLITNSEGTTGLWSRDDVGILDSMPDEKLITLAENQEESLRALEVANIANKGFQGADGSQYRLNLKTGQWEQRPTTNMPHYGREPEDDGVPRRPPARRPAVEPEPEAEFEEEEYEEYEEEPQTNRRRRPARPQTVEEWVAQAPPEVRNTFRYAREIEDREKEAIIQRLLINVDEADRPAHKERLQRRPLDDLMNDLALIPGVGDQAARNAAAQQQQPQPSRNTRRQAAAVAEMRRFGVASTSDDDMLPIPVMNWHGEEAAEEVSTANRNMVYDPGDLQSLTEDEWLKTAPPAIRNSVQNAMIIEGKEKRRLVEQLTANITDDDTEQRVSARLMSKPLEELRDLVAIMPKGSESRTSNFLGASTPLTNRSTLRLPSVPLIDSDDILLPPKMDYSEDKRTA